MPSRRIRTPRDKLLAAVIVTDVLLFFVFCGMWSLSNNVNDARIEGVNQAKQAREDTLANRENGFKNRAANCQILIDLGDTAPPAACREPEVVRYYDINKAPTAGTNSPAQVKNRALLCLDLRLRGQEPPNCMDPNAPVPGVNDVR